MDLLDRLLGHDRWTTRRLLELSAPLDDAALDHEFDIAHGTVRRTFEHIIRNVEVWTRLMRSSARRMPPISGLSIAELTDRYDAAYSEFAGLARTIAADGRLDASFIDTEDNPPREKTFGGAILHLATHGMHHRAQLLYMLRRLGIADLPEGDALTWERMHRENSA